MATELFRFGPFTLDPRKRLLCNRGARVELGPKVIETLTVLVENAGSLVTKDDLMERVWPNRYVEEGNVTQNIYRLRRVFSAAGLPDAIETMPCRGYRFATAVDRVGAGRDLMRPGYAKAPGRSRWTALAFGIACATVLLTSSTFQPKKTPAFMVLSRESQRLYTLGRYHWNLRSDPAHVRDSIRYFQDVVRRDPRNPLGYSGLADAYMALFDIYCESSVKACPHIVAMANANAKVAVNLGPQSAEAHTSLAMTIHEFTGQIARSDAEFARAIALDGDYALAHHWYGNSLIERGRLAQAIVQHRIALSLEPASPATYAWLAEDAFLSRQYRAAVSYAEASLAIYPNRHPTRVLLGLAYEQLGNEKAAFAVFDRLPVVERDALEAELYAHAGLRTRAVRMLRAIASEQAFGSGCTLEMAFAWIAVGDRRRAYSLMTMTQLSDEIERHLLALDPRLTPLRSDSRFKRWTDPG